MANNYDQATVQPCFPISSVTEFEKELLAIYGFDFETSDSEDGDVLYFFARDSTRDEIDDLDVDSVLEHAQQGDPIAIKLQEFINENGEDELDAYVSSQFSWVSIFQGILKKPECKDIDDICVMAAFTCDRFRPGEFGGWVCRITRNSVQCDGTYAAYERMKKECEFLAALDIVLAMANGHILDQVDVDDDPELASEFKEQHHALCSVGDYLKQHAFVD